MIKNIIEEIRNYRTGVNAPWIFDENGNISDNVLLVDVIDFLEGIEKYEVDFTEEEYVEAYNNKNNKHDNTYNYDCKTSNNIDYILDYDNNRVYFKVHLCGDARANYTDICCVEFDSYADEFFEVESAMETREIDKYICDISIFSDTISIYDKDFNTLCYTSQMELKDALGEIEEICG